MISFKKSYAEQLLQLALALSLLQVDPDSYLGHGWDSHLELRNGDGWQLEMLRAVPNPISEYPYANRKAVIPLIEDLVRFDRHSQGLNDITAYLLNVQNSQSNQTAGGGQESEAGAGSIVVELPPVTSAPAPPNSTVELDFFVNLEEFIEQTPMMDQNLADLREYGDIPLSSFPYFGLPMKDEPTEFPPLVEFPVKSEQPSTSASNNGPRTNDSEGFLAGGLLQVKKEEEDEDDKALLGALLSDTLVKKEEPEEASETSSTTDDLFQSLVELTEEESEIVEVLWKQDVDLGFSLAPPKLDKPVAEAGSSKSSADEAEKLKALQDLKDDSDKSKDDDDDSSEKDDPTDEWAGIPFTVDNETGEYIRLPLQLDELLQDVLQLADLTADDQEQIDTDKTIDLKPSASDPKTSIEESTSSLLSSNVATSTVARGSATSNETTTVEPPQSEVEVASDLFNLDNADALDELDMMIQSAGSFQHHRPGQNYGTNSVFRQTGFHHHHQSRVPLARGVSMEQRLQDIANLFNPLPAMGVGMGVSEMSPYSHYPTHYPYQGAPAIPQHGQFPHPSHHPVLHNASLADLGSQPHYGHNLGSAVSSSMHLTNSSHDTDSGASGYKMEHDMMYYSNTSSELNHTTDGFINSILNDEDLQLMDMGVNESFCTMRMLEGNATSNNSSVLGSSGASHGSHMLSMPTNLGNLSNEVIGTNTGDRLDASSDSAVSSMGSERVPSLSDGEWGDAGSDSAQDYHQGKYGGPYDYSYNGRLGGETARQPPVAQKKHQMFGKRYFQEQPNIPSLTQPSSTTQPPTDHLPPVPVKYEYDAYGSMHHPSAGAAGSIASSMEGAVGPIVHKDHHVPLMTNAEMKYACSLDFGRPPRLSGNPALDMINHNHTYTLPQGSGSAPRPHIRDKKQKRADDEHLTRDEKRARALSIPITVNDIINLPMDEFNERLSKYDLNETQLSLIRDIRRRGKNKVAAQNCRKRKLDQILSLEDEVKEVRRRKDRLCHDREVILAERKRIASKFAALHRHVFQYLRDSDGNPCSPSQYSLQQAADGSVYLLRRENNKPENNTTTSHSGHHHQHHHSHHSSSQGPSPPSSSSSSQHQKE